MVLYKPDGPYVIQSGKRKGEALELLMFRNYGFLVWWFKELNKKMKSDKKNRLHKYLEWLLQQGENRPIQKLCRFCQKRLIAYLSVLGDDIGGYSMGIYYSCCGDENCKKQLVSLALEKFPMFLPIKFSSILTFRRKSDQKQFANLLKEVFQINKGKLTRDKAFQFFSALQPTLIF